MADAAGLLRSTGHRAMPWRNGGGLTREIACAPDLPGSDGFDWRISMAEVGTAGPFSTFPGVDRVIVRVGAAPLVLTIDGVEQELARFAPLRFRGESDTRAELPGGPTKDLNVMTRRGRADADVVVRALGPGLNVVVPRCADLVLVVLEGTVQLATTAAPLRLDPTDAFRQAGPASLDLVGRGVVALVEIVEVAGTADPPR